MDVCGGVKIPEANVDGSSDAVTEVIPEAVVDDVSKVVDIHNALTNFKEKSLGLPAKSPGEFFAW